MNRSRRKPVCIFLIKRNGLPYRWVVKSTVNKERTYIGCFDSEAKAVDAWNKHAMKTGKEPISVEKSAI